VAALPTNNKESRITLFGVYIKPGDNNSRRSAYDFIGEYMRSNAGNYVVAGDFNARLVTEDYNNKSAGNKNLEDREHQGFVLNNDLCIMYEEKGRVHTFEKNNFITGDLYTTRIDDILYRVTHNGAPCEARIGENITTVGSDHTPLTAVWMNDLGMLSQGKGRGGNK